MPKFKRYTKEQLTQAVKESFSLANVMRLLGINAKGGNYRSVKGLIKECELDTSHFTGMLWSKDRVLGPKLSVEEYLNDYKKIGSNKLKKRLLKEGYFDPICDECKNTIWNNQPIPLELHHKDGNHLNNYRINLQLLCPNCHSLTDSFRSKNKGKMVPEGLEPSTVKL